MTTVRLLGQLLSVFDTIKYVMFRPHHSTETVHLLKLQITLFLCQAKAASHC